MIGAAKRSPRYESNTPAVEYAIANEARRFPLRLIASQAMATASRTKALIADATGPIGFIATLPARNTRWEHCALPATFVLALVVVFELHHVSSPVGTAQAAAASKPDYVMTITARRLPGECRARSASLMPASCRPYLTGDAVVEMREQSSR